MTQDDDSLKTEINVQIGGDNKAKTTADNETRAARRKEIVIPSQFGRYRIVRELGRGNMGVVFLAHDDQLDRSVAIKIPFFSEVDDESVTERFYREARAMATVHHPHLCPVYDVGKHEHWHFLTMAYIDGQPLSRVIKEAGGLPLDEAAVLLRTISLALHKAHEAGLVHRDLKPSNIMLTRDGQPTVMDFGLARRSRPNEAELTQTGAVIGSPAYMAPEQVEARHDDVGPHTDVYALGVMFYQMVTGRTPFSGSTASVFGQILSSAPPPPSKYREGLPNLVDRICIKAMAKEPSERYRSAIELAGVLTQLIGRDDGSVTETLPLFAVHSSSDGGQGSGSTHTSKVRREAELRQVTLAVFSYEAPEDSLVVNRTSHSEQLMVRSQSFASLAIEQITKFGGSILQNNGQEVIACWGFPQTLEGSSQQAVHAALQLSKCLATIHGGRHAHDSSHPNALPTQDQYWAVIHSGETIAEEVASRDGHSVLLIGEARNTLMRLNAIAEPGSVLISNATHHRVALFFECESAGSHRLRGLSHPIEMFRVLKESVSRNRVELVDPSNLTPLVGRDTELSILKDRWEQALEGLGQIVLLIGDAGLGKSRLIREIREHVIQSEASGPSGPQEVAVIEWRCSQYHQNASYYPMIDFFYHLLELEKRTPLERLETVARYLCELKMDSVENVWLLCGVLNIPTDDRYPALALSPQKIKERTDAIFFQWLDHLAQVRPVLFIVEDLHWLDPTTLELLEKYVSEYECGRVLCILTFRPEFETPWKSKPHQTQIALNRLTKRQIGEMMRKRMQRTTIPEAIVEQVIERTDGVPLFIEEFAVVILESGVLDRSDAGEDSSALLQVIPVTLNDLLFSRLDWMEADREVIQLAAALGREFDFGLLHACCNLSGDQLHQELDKLVHAEILFAKGKGDSVSYIFKHALLQDAAYRSILTKKRQQYHHRISEALESGFPDLVQAQPALLAHHFTEAGLTETAIQYWLKAGLRSQEQSANVEAIRHFRNGIQLAMTLPPSPQRDAIELSIKLPLSAVLMAVQGYAAPEVEPVQNRCIEICRQLGEGAPLFPVLCANWEWLFIRGRFQDCYHRCPELIAIAEEQQGPGMLAEAYWTQGCTSFYAGDFELARQYSMLGAHNHHRQASIEYVKITQQNSGPLNLAYWGLALWQLGLVEQSFQRLDEALAMALDLGHRFTLAMTTWKLAQVRDFALLGEETIDYSRRVRRIAEEQGFAFWSALGTGCEGVGLQHLERYDEAIETLHSALNQLSATGSFILFPKYRSHLAACLWRVGRTKEAVQQLDQAFVDQSGGEYFMHSELLRLRGDFATDRSEWELAESYYRQAIDVASKQGANMYRLRSAVHLGQLWLRTDKKEEISKLVEPLTLSFTEGHASIDFQRAKSLLESL